MKLRYLAKIFYCVLALICCSSFWGNEVLATKKTQTTGEKLLAPPSVKEAGVASTPTPEAIGDADSCLIFQQQSVPSKFQIDLSLLPRNMFTPDQYSQVSKLDGSTFQTEEEFRQSLFVRFGNMLSEAQISLLINHSHSNSAGALQKLSLLEKQLQPSSDDATVVSSRQILCQFGYDLLRAGKLVYDPMASPALLKNYRLGPGDEIIVYGVTADAGESNKVVINGDGVLLLPQMPPISAWNLTLDELEKKLQQYARFVRIAMGSLRSIHINVLGEVRSAGLHRIPATTTLYNALALTGGIKKTGSLRKIQWMRDNKLLKEVDLYNYLTNGSMLETMNLQNGDVLFVPLITQAVSISGEVYRPGIFELKGENSLSDVLRLAGGPLPTANSDRVVVDRIGDQQEKTIKQLSLKNSPDTEKIYNFDIIKIFPVASKYSQFFIIKGPFSNPGEFELKPGMTLSDALSLGGKLTEEVLLSEGQIQRLHYSKIPTAPEMEIISFNYQQVLEKKTFHDLVLQTGDVIQVFPKKTFFPEVVSIQGNSVRNPGEYPFTPGMTIAALIAKAQGLKNDALDSHVVIRRWQSIEETWIRQPITVQINPQTLETFPLLVLQKGDSVFLRQKAEFYDPVFASIYGEVRYPGVYEIIRGETLNTLIQRAGGFTDQAFLEAAVFTRRLLREKENIIDERVQQDVDRALIQSNLEQSAKINQTDTSMDLATVAAVKGLHDDPEGNNSDKAFQLSALKRGGSGASDSENTTKVRKTDASKLLGRNQGRLIIELEPYSHFPGSADDIRLLPDDSLVIPPKTESVLIKGEVFGEASLPIRENATAYYYLESLGGPRQLALLEDVYILRANGMIVNRNLDQYIVRPGDSIIVPPDLRPRENPIQNTASYAQVIQTILLSVTLIAILL